MAAARKEITAQNPVTGKKNTIPKAPESVERPLSPLGGLLSLLVPGFGQIYQGRIAKGVLFFVCIYLMFFYGFALGQGKNVFLGRTAKEENPLNLPVVLADLYNRPQYAAQFWTGLVAWPALWQYYHSGTDDKEGENRNVAANKREADDGKKGGTIFGNFQRALSEDEQNDLQRNSDKTWDLGWVMTVIAGVLNILVIYDAVAGPAFGNAPPKKEEDEPEDTPKEEETTEKGNG